jgi:hypothetical protein
MIKKIAGTSAGLYLLTLITLLSVSCGQRKASNSLPGSELQHHVMKGLTEVIVHDILSPPVASRIYAYSTLAFHEALAPGYREMRLLTPAFKGFDALPEAPKSGEADFRLSATVAFFTVARKLVFSKDSLNKYEESALESFDGLSDEVRERSESWGHAVAACILKRANSDNYRQTRSMPRFSVFGEPGKWQQTPPDYTDATEPHWALIRPLRMDSAGQCRPLPPPPFDTLEASEFGRELKEVYDVNLKLTPSMDSIARFWDDNPFVSQHVGHLTYATKKLTPVGHWMGIKEILCRQQNTCEALTATAYASTAAAIFDAFISCWEEKYRSNKVRPVTAIRERFDSEWSSLLQTPSFPEYTSGHSVITAAAATVLSSIFGAETPFVDTTEMEYLGMKRSFSSIDIAADEAGISRLYGGIHFRSAIVNGKKQGQNVGRLFIPLLH